MLVMHEYNGTSTVAFDFKAKPRRSNSVDLVSLCAELNRQEICVPSEAFSGSFGYRLIFLPADYFHIASVFSLSYCIFHFLCITQHIQTVCSFCIFSKYLLLMHMWGMVCMILIWEIQASKVNGVWSFLEQKVAHFAL